LTTGCIVYTNIQPAVKPVWQPVWQNGCIVYTAGCQTGCHTGLYNRFDKHGLTTGCIHDTAVLSNGCQTGLTAGWMFVYTIQPVVKPVWQRVWQPVVSCKRGFSLFELWACWVHHRTTFCANFNRLRSTLTRFAFSQSIFSQVTYGKIFYKTQHDI